MGLNKLPTPVLPGSGLRDCPPGKARISAGLPSSAPVILSVAIISHPGPGYNGQNAGFFLGFTFGGGFTIIYPMILCPEAGALDERDRYAAI